MIRSRFQIPTIMLAVWLTAFCACFAKAGAPEVADSTEVPEVLAAAIQESLQKNGIPGASIAVIDGYRILWAEGFGLANLADAQAVTVHTRFQACSLSKPIAARALLTLVDPTWRARGRTGRRDPHQFGCRRRSDPTHRRARGGILWLVA